MTLRWFVLVALCACGLAAAPADASTPSRAAFELSSAGKKLLTKNQTLAVGDWTIGVTARIDLKGTLRFRSGRRTVSAAGLTVTVSRTSSYVSAKLGGGKRLRLLTITPTTP